MVWECIRTDTIARPCSQRSFHGPKGGGWQICHVLPGRFLMFSKFVMFSNRLCNWCLQLASHICYLFGQFFHQPPILLPHPVQLVGGPLIKYLPIASFFSIFGPTAAPKILVFRALALGARSPIYDKLGINNPSSKSSPLHILLHAILVPEQRCFVSPTGRPR